MSEPTKQELVEENETLQAALEEAYSIIAEALGEVEPEEEE